MRFNLRDREFEIPDGWWAAAGMKDWRPNASHYQEETGSDRKLSAVVVPLSDVAAPVRDEGLRWFEERRMRSILTGFRDGACLPPIEVFSPSGESDFRFSVRNGFHRFYASVAVGFTHLPVLIFPYD